MTGRKTSACSDKCRAAKSRRRAKADAQAERDQWVREWLEAALRHLAESIGIRPGKVGHDTSSNPCGRRGVRDGRHRRRLSVQRVPAALVPRAAGVRCVVLPSERCRRALASVGIHGALALIPGVTKGTDRCLALPHPFGGTRPHMVIFPKEDIKNIADVTVADQPYVMDCLGVIRALVVENGLRGYRVTRTAQRRRTSRTRLFTSPGDAVGGVGAPSDRQTGGEAGRCPLGVYRGPLAVR